MQLKKNNVLPYHYQALEAIYKWLMIYNILMTQI